MKKICVLSLLIVTSIKTTMAEDSVLKNFRFGLKALPVISWIKPDDIKKFKNAGVSLKFNYGLITEFKLTKTAVFATGFDFNSYGGTIEYQNSTTKYDIPDVSTTDSLVSFLISKRNYNMKTYEIPLTLKLRTPEIGSLTYFAQFGINVGIRGKVKSNDEGKYISEGVKSHLIHDDGPTTERPDNIITKDMNLFRLGLNVGVGAEYNLIGSTSLVISINYFNAFLNTLKNTSKELQTINTKTNKYDFVTQNVKSNAAAFNIGFIF